MNRYRFWISWHPLSRLRGSESEDVSGCVEGEKILKKTQHGGKITENPSSKLSYLKLGRQPGHHPLMEGCLNFQWKLKPGVSGQNDESDLVASSSAYGCPPTGQTHPKRNTPPFNCSSTLAETSSVMNNSKMLKGLN